MAIITNIGRAAMAKAIMSQAIHIAIGEGSPDWVAEPPRLDYDATALTRETNRFAAQRVIFVNLDDNGEFELPGNRRYSASLTPTRNLYLHTQFGYNDGVESLVREIGVFIGTVAKPEVPSTRKILLPNEIQDPGILLYMAYPIDADKFNPQKSGKYELLITV